jgi:hypothetical protein
MALSMSGAPKANVEQNPSRSKIAAENEELRNLLLSTKLNVERLVEEAERVLRRTEEGIKRISLNAQS